MKGSDSFRRTKRIVVKIGSSSITESDTVSSVKISKFASDIAELKKKGMKLP